MFTNNIEKLLGKYLCDTYNIDTQKEYKIEYISAKELMVADRIDLIVKYKYVEAKERKIKIDFFKDLYKAHIQALTVGTYTEEGQEATKNSLKKYINIFDKLIENIKIKGINPELSVIPVGANNIILDGAHRVSISAFYGLDVPVVRFENIHISENIRATCGIAFFQHMCMLPDYIDYMVLEYCRLKQNCFAACMWPKSNSKPELIGKAEEILSSHCKIIYKKKININWQFIRNFIIQVYSDFDWLGNWENHFKGASYNADTLYDKSNLLTLYVLDNCTLKDVQDAKSEIRELFGLGNSSMHSTDTYRETIEMLELLLNENSVHYLKYGKPDKFKNFNKLFVQFKNLLISQNVNFEDVIVDSSSIMALYGLRDTKDFDYISDIKIISDNPNIDRHDKKEYYYYYERDIFDLIYNPKNHLYFLGLKFVCIDLLTHMKKIRFSANKEAKDGEDLKLLALIKKEEDVKEQNWNKAMKYSIFAVKRYCRHLRPKIEKILSNSFILKPIRRIYHLIKGTPYHG